MKRKILLVTLIATFILSISPVSGQTNDLTGKWKIDRTKSSISEYYPTLVRLDIQFRDNTVFTERVYDTGDGQEYPFTENIPLDGKPYSLVIYDMPRKSKAVWLNKEGILNIESTTTFNGSNGTEDFVSNETWKLDKDKNTLSVSFTNKTSAGESSGSFVYTKAE